MSIHSFLTDFMTFHHIEERKYKCMSLSKEKLIACQELLKLVTNNTEGKWQPPLRPTSTILALFRESELQAHHESEKVQAHLVN